MFIFEKFSIFHSEKSRSFRNISGKYQGFRGWKDSRLPDKNVGKKKNLQDSEQLRRHRDREGRKLDPERLEDIICGMFPHA